MPVPADVLDRYRKIAAVAAPGSGATDGERANAGRLLAGLAARHPGIAQEAARAAAGPAGGSAPGPTPGAAPGPYPGPVPGPFDAGAYGGRGRRPAPAPGPSPAPGPGPGPAAGAAWWDAIAGKARDFVADALNDLGLGYSLSDLADTRTEVEVKANSRTIHVHVRIPVDVLESIADLGEGSGGTYAKLLGARVGATVADVLRRNGLT